MPNNGNGHHPPANGRKMGRPRGSGKFKPEHAELILAQLAEGKTLNQICDQDGMPSKALVLAWATGLGKNEPPIPDFYDRYVHARKLGCLVWADQIVQISDESDGRDMAGVASAKLRADSRKWLLARLMPDQFGDRLQLNQQGGNVQVHITLPALENDPKLIEGTATEIEDAEQ